MPFAVYLCKSLPERIKNKEPCCAGTTPFFGLVRRQGSCFVYLDFRSGELHIGGDAVNFGKLICRQRRGTDDADIV